MANESIYERIAGRTGGNVYLGVVGPVRTGKSTLIRRVMEVAVLPSMEDESERERARDQTPQSGTGRTIMTTEPKFVPEAAATVSVGEGVRCGIRLVDCVGYPVEGALGTEEGGESRMVRTPWSEEAMPFAEAATLGTQKVIREHSTIGLLVTADGSFGELPREAFVAAEERVAKELSELGTPFVVVLNSADPGSEATRRLALSLEEKYAHPVAAVSCLSLDQADVEGILSLALREFPLRRLSVKVPRWVRALPKEHPTRGRMYEKVRSFAESLRRLSQVERHSEEGVSVVEIRPEDGTAAVKVVAEEGEFYEALSGVSGLPLSDERDVMEAMVDYARVKSEFARMGDAWRDVNEKGYGIVMPNPDELEFEEPSKVKSTGGWGVKMRAKAESIHMIRTGLTTELSPVVGTEEQSEQVIRYLLAQLEEDPKKVWQSNMFGRSLYDLVYDGLEAKLANMPESSRGKLSETLERIINEGSSGLICILL